MECIILISLQNATSAFQVLYPVLKGRCTLGLRYWDFLFSEEYNEVFSRGKISSLHYMSCLASQWKLRNKTPLLFVVTLLANRFILPGLYSCLPRGEKLRKITLIGSLSADKNPTHCIKNHSYETPNKKFPMCDVF